MVSAWLIIICLVAFGLAMPLWVKATAPFVDRLLSRWDRPITPLPPDDPARP